jgi:hypothetical protein
MTSQRNTRNSLSGREGRLRRCVWLRGPFEAATRWPPRATMQMAGPLLCTLRGLRYKSCRQRLKAPTITTSIRQPCFHSMAGTAPRLPAAPFPPHGQCSFMRGWRSAGLPRPAVRRRKRPQVLRRDVHEQCPPRRLAVQSLYVPTISIAWPMTWTSGAAAPGRACTNSTRAGPPPLSRTILHGVVLQRGDECGARHPEDVRHDDDRRGW